eukprot:CAMPEP_0115844468 /NCGR_PEP_ID=MMETSP0287-20121206/8843_1 /TAXON_ID=412157 /ORGANISM="Chrysochromulina rotalis, Strain UIO044" /LENGTH=44 /DNA_ID= /DNA_START= /DNA_END= /DNA_ORIENTATION=
MTNPAHAPLLIALERAIPEHVLDAGGALRLHSLRGMHSRTTRRR